MRHSYPRIAAVAAGGALLLALCGCGATSAPDRPRLLDALPAMQAGPTTVGPDALGPAGRGSAIGPGNLAGPGASGPRVGAGFH